MQYNLNLTHVLYFCQIVEHKSMSQAADVLHIAQPSLSMAIKKLEENLGFSLFERKNRQLYLTPQGKAFYEEAKLLVEHSRALEERIDDIKANKHRIRLG
ncbi:MAG: LysR family transcriptional regulator, partial [Veillonella sp.]|nr:LysR family transcriptional regulator [Veillonella sp.]